MDAKPSNQILSTSVSEGPAGTVRVDLVGELDLSTISIVVSAFEALDPRVTSVIVDLSRLEFIDSSGIGALIAQHRRASETAMRFDLEGATGSVKRVLELTGVSEMVNGPRQA